MTNTPGGMPPAGWYPDPDAPDHLRYWDGAVWTEQRRAAASMPPPTMGGTPTPPPPPAGPAGNSQAGTALGLSIFGLICCGIAAPFGMVMGRNEVQAIDRGAGNPSQRSTAQAAFIIGAIATGLYALGLLIWMIAVAASSGT